jgi:hypothetical protein
VGTAGTKLSLFISLPSNMSSDRISSEMAQMDRAELLEADTTIFRAAQRRFIASASASSRSLPAENGYKLWDTMYTITYRRTKPSDADVTPGVAPWTPAFVDENIGGPELPKAQVFFLSVVHVPMCFCAYLHACVCLFACECLCLCLCV